MTAPPKLLTHFADIAPGYDALICDVWGVLHNGAVAFKPACDALKNFRDRHGRVILLSNAPRPASDLEIQFERFGVPLDCYDTIITSGGAAREDLARRAGPGGLRLLHLGPERDLGLFTGLSVERVGIEQAQLVFCTGPYNDEIEGPDDYTEMFAALRARDLTMLCANPDYVVQRGGRLVYCAGSLAQAYEKLGGQVVYFGKPHKPIYDHVRAVAGGARRFLAIGDGLATDIRGANAAGIDSVLVLSGIHGEDVAEFTERHLADLFTKYGGAAQAAMRALVW